MEDFHADNILLVELFGPTLRNSILDLILDHHFVRALSEGLCQRLLVKFIEFVIELGDHLLNIRTLLFGINLLEDGYLNILLREKTLLHE